MRTNERTTEKNERTNERCACARVRTPSLIDNDLIDNDSDLILVVI